MCRPIILSPNLARLSRLKSLLSIILDLLNVARPWRSGEAGFGNLGSQYRNWPLHSLTLFKFLLQRVLLNISMLPRPNPGRTSSRPWSPMITARSLQLPTRASRTPSPGPRLQTRPSASPTMTTCKMAALVPLLPAATSN